MHGEKQHPYKLLEHLTLRRVAVMVSVHKNKTQHSFSAPTYWTNTSLQRIRWPKLPSTNVQISSASRQHVSTPNSERVCGIPLFNHPGTESRALWGIYWAGVPGFSQVLSCWDCGLKCLTPKAFCMGNATVALVRTVGPAAIPVPTPKVGQLTARETYIKT